MTEFNHYETITLELARKDKNYMEKTTSCLYPCKYTQYKVKRKFLCWTKNNFSAFIKEMLELNRKRKLTIIKKHFWVLLSLTDYIWFCTSSGSLFSDYRPARVDRFNTTWSCPALCLDFGFSQDWGKGAAYPCNFMFKDPPPPQKMHYEQAQYICNATPGYILTNYH